MASAKVHDASTLDGTKTTYWDGGAEGGTGPRVWVITPSVACELFLTGGYTPNTTAIPVAADEDYYYYDPDNKLTKIEANKATGESDGTITIKPAAGV
jgi:hypothetical protein